MARCFFVKSTMISLFLSCLRVAGCGSCLYLIFAVTFAGISIGLPIRCHPVVVIFFPNNALSSFSPTTTIFFFTSVFITYALKGSLSPCLCPMVKKYAPSCLPTIFPSIVMISHAFFGNFFSRNSLIGIFPMKHNPWLSFLVAFGNPIFFANALISGFVYPPIGNNDLLSCC